MTDCSFCVLLNEMGGAKQQRGVKRRRRRRGRGEEKGFLVLWGRLARNGACCKFVFILPVNPYTSVGQ